MVFLTEILFFFMIEKADFLLRVIDVLNRCVVFNPLIIKDDTWEFILFVIMGILDHIIQVYFIVYYKCQFFLKKNCSFFCVFHLIFFQFFLSKISTIFFLRKAKELTQRF